MTFNAITWVNNKLSDEESQQKLEQHASLLLSGPLKGKGEYAQEKALKVFSENISYFESRLQYEKGIHPRDLDPVEFVLNKERIIQDMLEVKRLVGEEIERHHNLFLVFMNGEEIVVKESIYSGGEFETVSAQQKLILSLEGLDKGLLADKDKRVKEAAIKLFTEGLFHLENILLYQRELHPNQKSVLNNNAKKEKLETEVERTLDVELRRQYRHFAIFV